MGIDPTADTPGPGRAWPFLHAPSTDQLVTEHPASCLGGRAPGVGGDGGVCMHAQAKQGQLKSR